MAERAHRTLGRGGGALRRGRGGQVLGLGQAAGGIDTVALGPRCDAFLALGGRLVQRLDPDTPGADNWPDHLALWARHHQEQENALPLERYVVDLSSPELTAAQLIGAPEMAELGGITASTLA